MGDIKFDWRLETKETFYDTLLEWWKKHNAFGGEKLDFDLLPSRVFVVSRGGVDLYALSIYVTDSTLCWVGWVTSNPEAESAYKVGALDFIYEIAIIAMKGQGYKTMLSHASDKNLIKALEVNNFTSTGESIFYTKKL
jgi:hypothetical protein